MMKTNKILIISSLFYFIFSAQAKDSYEKSLENKIFKLVNYIRKQNNIPPLKINKKLNKIAKIHSLDMAKNNYTSHISLDGLDPNARAKRAGFNIIKKEKNKIKKGIGENIFEAQFYKEINGIKKPYLEKNLVVAQKAVDSWTKSEGHRKNILNSDYRETGIGVAISKDKKIKITQVFF